MVLRTRRYQVGRPGVEAWSLLWLHVGEFGQGVVGKLILDAWQHLDTVAQQESSAHAGYLAQQSQSKQRLG